jgi:O-antigen/teichoic acid export membrane protein
MNNDAMTANNTSGKPFADHHFTEVLKGSAFAILMRGASAALFLLFNLVLARILGPEGAGIYFLAFTMITIASVISRLGLDQALLRFISASAVTSKWGEVSDIYRKGVIVIFLSSIAITLLLYTLTPFLATTVFSEPALLSPLRIMILAILPLTLLSLNSESLRALKHIRNALFTHAQGPGLAFFALLLLLFLGGRHGVNGAVGAYLLSCVIMTLVSFVIWRASTAHNHGMTGTFNTGELLKTGFYLLFIASMNMLMNWTDTVMLGIWKTSDAVGIYNISLRLALMTTFMLSAAATILAPKFSGLYVQGDMAALKNLVRKSTRLIAASALPIALILVLLPHTILGFFGSEFKSGALALIILSIGHLFYASVGCLGHLLIMTGNHVSVHRITLLTAILNIALNALLIPDYGINGAALATGFSICVFNFSCVVAVRRHLGIRIF